jgi:hypothetical protein
VYESKSNRNAHVLKGLYALRVAVRSGLCSLGSQTLTVRCSSLSSEGGLSTMYDIQACLRWVSTRGSCSAVSNTYQPGSICVLYHVSDFQCCHLRARNVRIELLVLVVYPSCPYCVSVRSYPVSALPPRTWQLLLKILIVLVAVSVQRYQCSSLGITCLRSACCGPNSSIHDLIPIYYIRGVFPLAVGS